MEVYLIDGTYELFRHYYALPSARDADGREVAAVRGVVASVLGMINGRRDARRRRDRSRHRIVSQSAVARLQDERRHRPPICWRSSRCSKTRSPRSASSSGRWSSSRRTTRWRPRRRRAARGSARRPGHHLHAGQGPGAVRPRHTRRPAEPPDARDTATRPASSRSSACRRRRFPTTWRSSATRPTGIRACAAGARSRRPRCSRGFGNLEAIPRGLARLARECDERGHAGADARSASAIGRSCSDISRRCEPTSRCSHRSTT